MHIGGTAVLLPFIQQEFDMPKASVAWLLVVYFLSTASFMLVAAHLGNTFGRRKLVLIGVAIDLFALTAQFFMPFFWGLVALRLIGGIGNAMPVTNMAPLTVSAFPDQKRGQVLGLLNLGLGIGIMVSAPVAGIIADSLGWRYVYLVSTVPYVALLVGVFLLTKESQELSKDQISVRRFDYSGFLLMVGFLAFLTFGMQGLGASATNVLALALLVLAVALVAGFVVVERRSEYPLLPLRLFDQPAFSAAVVRLSAFSLMRAALTFLLPFYFVEGLSWSGTFAGSVLISMNAGHPVVAPFSGVLADRFGAPRLIFAAFLVMTAGGILLVSLGNAPPVAMVVGSLIMVGVAFGLFAPPNQKTIYEGVPRERLSLAPGVQVLVAHSSNAVGSALAAMLLGLFLWDGIAVAYQWSVLTLLAGFVGLMAASIWVVRSHRRERRPVAEG